MKYLVLALATGLGTGYSPKAPGTVGSILGVVILWALKVWQHGSWYLILALIPVGIGAAHQAEKYLGEHDSPKIVIDEIVGILIAGYLIPAKFLIIVFLLFRFFDIVKPGPIASIQRLPGGLGVMADDLLAGLIVYIIITSILLL